MVTENGHKFEFFDHRFLIDYLDDDHRHKVSKKSSQIGETVAELFDDFYQAIHKKRNVIHTLHNNDVLKGFVQPKVDPIIARNPEIKKYNTVDSQGLKQFKDNFVFFRGANSESQAISISADILKIDEKDRSNLKVVEMFESRLDFSDWKWIREFSNPSAVGIGVDETYSRSDQRHWFVQCHHCNYNMYIDFEQNVDDMSHYVDEKRLIFACGRCDKELSTTDRKNGEWIAKWPSRDKVHGYWFSQMMAPWFTAEEIVDKFQNSSIEYFYNFVLGKAYTPQDMLFDRDSIIRNTDQREINHTPVVMGSDIGKPHWYFLATPEGYFKHGRADSWDDLEYLFNFYKCDAWVMDSMPEFTKVQEMLRKYPGRAYACQFVPDRAAIGAIRWQEGDKRGFVYADRTKVIDRVVTEVATQQMPYFEREDDMEDLIGHAKNMYRSVEVDEKGAVKIGWMTLEGKPDHLVFAQTYCRIALERVFSAVNSNVVTTTSVNARSNIVPTVVNGKIHNQFDIQGSMNKAKYKK
jgi:hypothetical protein